MAVTMAEISKLRKLTGAGMMDCKNALTETTVISKLQKKLFVKKVKLSLLNAKTAKLRKVAFWLLPKAISLLS